MFPSKYTKECGGHDDQNLYGFFVERYERRYKDPFSLMEIDYAALSLRRSRIVKDAGYK